MTLKYHNSAKRRKPCLGGSPKGGGVIPASGRRGKVFSFSWENAMSRSIEVTPGETYGRWTVIGEMASIRLSGTTYRQVLCRCTCGTTRAVRLSGLTSGHSTSCGCKFTTFKHGCLGTPTYRSWQCMIRRCYDVRNTSYPRYGGRGIEVHDAWKDSFIAFLADMGERPPKHTLDRIDNGRNYEPENCRWATWQTQQRNRQNNRMIEFNGETLCMTEWANRLGVKPATIHWRLAAGWAIEDAVTMPSKRRKASHV